jgi:hypothetical protein
VINRVGKITYRFNAHVMDIINSAKAKPRPTTMPYPKPRLRGTVKWATLLAIADNLEGRKQTGSRQQSIEKVVAQL